MHKKLGLLLVAVAGLISAALTMAAGPTVSGYITSDHSQASLSSATGLAAMTTYPTEIRIVNGRNDYISVVAPMTLPIDSGEKKFIQHPTSSADVHLIIQDQRANIIFDGTVCRYALITVYGDSNSYGSHVTRVKC